MTDSPLQAQPPPPPPSQDAIRQQQQRRNQKQQILTDCWAFQKYDDLPFPNSKSENSVGRSSVDTVIQHFQNACSTTKFQEQFASSGFTNPSFHPNTQLKLGVPAYDKLQFGLKVVVIDDDASLSNCSFGVVFHGTSTTNLPLILRNGLDPNKRKGQAFGPGEYFSKEPALSVSFCRGGLEMLVFVVMILDPTSSSSSSTSSSSPTPPPTPPSQQAAPTASATNDPSNNNNSNTLESSIASHLAILRKFQKMIPPDYVIVENNCHQIPIGTMKFDAVDHNVLAKSRHRRSNFLELARHQAFVASRLAEETLLKSKIIQDLISNNIDVASERYQRNNQQNNNKLQHIAKREISWYVHQNVDKDVIPFYFPDLPEPLHFVAAANSNGNDDIGITSSSSSSSSSSNHNSTVGGVINVTSLDDAMRKEQEARKRLEDAERKHKIRSPLPKPPPLMAPGATQHPQYHSNNATGLGGLVGSPRPLLETEQNVHENNSATNKKRNTTMLPASLDAASTTGRVVLGNEDNNNMVHVSSLSSGPPVPPIKNNYKYPITLATTSERWFRQKQEEQQPVLEHFPSLCNPDLTNTPHLFVDEDEKADTTPPPASEINTTTTTPRTQSYDPHGKVTVTKQEWKVVIGANGMRTMRLEETTSSIVVYKF